MKKDRNGVERRHNDRLRNEIEEACRGVRPHIADRIARAARRAYWIGVADGMTVTGTLVCDNTVVFDKDKEVSNG